MPLEQRRGVRPAEVGLLLRDRLDGLAGSVARPDLQVDALFGVEALLQAVVERRVLAVGYPVEGQRDLRRCAAAGVPGARPPARRRAGGGAARATRRAMQVKNAFLIGRASSRQEVVRAVGRRAGWRATG